MLYQSYYFVQAKDVPAFKKIHVLYTTLGICVVGYNVHIVYRDPDAMQALVNNLVEISRRFYGNPFFLKLQ